MAQVYRPRANSAANSEKNEKKLGKEGKEGVKVR